MGTTTTTAVSAATKEGAALPLTESEAFAKQRVALRYILLGRRWYKAHDALVLAEHYHRGTRKDGVTPELAHPLSVALWVWTLEPLLMHPEETVCTALVHDLAEDYGISREELGDKFGPVVAKAAWALTKEYRSHKVPQDRVTEALASDPCASIVKAGDRLHNQGSLLGVFSQVKIAEYVRETSEHILPMLKLARRNWPSQEQAYQNARLALESQVSMLGHVVELMDRTPAGT